MLSTCTSLKCRSQVKQLRRTVFSSSSISTERKTLRFSYNGIISSLENAGKQKKIDFSYMNDALCYVARNHNVDQFIKVLSQIQRNQKLNANFSEKMIHMITARAVQEAAQKRPLSVAMDIWAAAAKQGISLENHELELLAGIFSRDVLNSEKQRIAESIYRWRVPVGFEGRQIQQTSMDSQISDWKVFSQEQKWILFKKMALSIDQRKVAFTISERQSLGELVQDVIDYLKNNRNESVSNHAFPQSNYFPLQVQFPMFVQSILAHYAAFGLHEDVMFFFRLVSRALTLENQLQCVYCILRHYNNLHTLATQLQQRHRIVDIEHRITVLQEIQKELLELVKVYNVKQGSSDLAPGSHIAYCQAAILDNLTIVYRQKSLHRIKMPYSVPPNLCKTLPAISVGHEEERFLFQYAENSLRNYLAEVKDEMTSRKSADKNLLSGDSIGSLRACSPSQAAYGASGLVDRIISMADALGKEWMIIQVVRLIIAIRTKQLHVPHPVFLTSTESNDNATSQSASKASVETIKLPISIYSALLGIVQSLHDTRLISKLMCHGLDGFLHAYYERTPTKINAFKGRVFVPSVKGIVKNYLSSASRTALSAAEVDYICKCININTRTHQHPEWSLLLLRYLRQYSRHSAGYSPISLFMQNTIVSNIVQATTALHDVRHKHSKSSFETPSDYADDDNLPTAEKLASDIDRLQKVLEEEPEVIAAWMLQSMRKQYGYGRLTGKELAVVVPLFLPLTRRLARLYAEGKSRDVGGKAIAEDSKRLMSESEFRIEVLERVTKFLQQQLCQHLELEGQEEALKEIWQRDVLPHEDMVKQLVRLFCEVELIPESWEFVRAVYAKDTTKIASANASAFMTSKPVKQNTLTAAVLEPIFAMIAQNKNFRSHDNLENLCTQLVSTAAKYEKEQEQTAGKAWSLRLKSFIANKSTEKSPILTTKLIDSIVRAKIYDAAFSDALDTALELYQQHGVRLSLRVFQDLYTIAVNRQDQHEVERIQHVLAYLYPGEATLLAELRAKQAQATTEGEAVADQLIEESAFHPRHSGMRLAALNWKTNVSMQARRKAFMQKLKSGNGELEEEDSDLEAVDSTKQANGEGGQDANGEEKKRIRDQSSFFGVGWF